MVNSMKSKSNQLIWPITTDPVDNEKTYVSKHSDWDGPAQSDWDGNKLTPDLTRGMVIDLHPISPARARDLCCRDVKSNFHHVAVIGSMMVILCYSVLSFISGSQTTLLVLAGTSFPFTLLIQLDQLLIRWLSTACLCFVKDAQRWRTHLKKALTMKFVFITR